MPIIRGIQILSDRIILDTEKGQRTFPYSRISNQIRNQGAEAVEAFVHAEIDNPENGFAVNPDGSRNFYMAVHVFTVDPLVFATIVSNDPITGEWWAPS